MTQSDEMSDDYYTFFNIPKDASEGDIVKAYHRLSRMYHPDRHSSSTDPELKKHAERLFRKTKDIYHVLSDPRKRAIYDTVGEKGLTMEGWEIAERFLGPEEIKAEFEQLERKARREREEAATHPTGYMSVTINAIELFQRPRAADMLEDDIFYPELEAINISQSTEMPVSDSDRLTLAGFHGMQRRHGNSGGINLGWTRLISSTMWSQMEIGAALGGNYSCSCKLFRTFSKSMFGEVKLGTRFGDDGFQPVLSLGLTRKLHTHAEGTVALKLGFKTSVTTSLIYDDITTRRIVTAIVLSDSASFLMCSYTHRLDENDAKVKFGCRIGTVGLILDCAYDRRIDEYSRGGAKWSFHVESSRLSLRLTLGRASQRYDADILLTEGEVPPSAIFWGIVAPIVVYNVIRIVVPPILERRRRRQKAKAGEESSAQALKRKEAKATIELMKETAERNKSREAEDGGLVIVEGLYGRLVGGGDAIISSTDAILDVRIPLQVLVRDSKLIIYERSKTNLPGFFDPCPGEPKSLKIKYLFRGAQHMVVVADDQPILIPKESHKIT